MCEKSLINPVTSSLGETIKVFGAYHEETKLKTVLLHQKEKSKIEIGRNKKKFWFLIETYELLHSVNKLMLLELLYL